MTKPPSPEEILRLLDTDQDQNQVDGLTIAITDLPNIAIYVCVTDMLHKSVGSTVGMRVGRCVSRGRDTTSV